jgi:addiction module HigA family antidote
MIKIKNPPHPGEILLEDFLKPLGISQNAFAKHIKVPFRRINEIVNGKRSVTPETAQLFAMAFGTTVEVWLGLQMQYDLATHPVGREVPRLRIAG